MTCSFNPLDTVVRDCSSSFAQDCSSAISGDWTSAIWVFGGVTGSPWLMFTKDDSSNNADLATLIETGVGHHSNRPVSGFSSSNPSTPSVLPNLYYENDQYITQKWSVADRDLSLFVDGPDSSRKCIARDCRSCTVPVWFLVRQAEASSDIWEQLPNLVSYSYILWEGHVNDLAECKSKCTSTTCVAVTYREGGIHPNKYCHTHSSSSGAFVEANPTDNPWNMYTRHV
jgi:hypothetical protein